MHVSEKVIDVDDNYDEERSSNGEDIDPDSVATTIVIILTNCTLYLVVVMKEITIQRLFTSIQFKKSLWECAHGGWNGVRHYQNVCCCCLRLYHLS